MIEVHQDKQIQSLISKIEAADQRSDLEQLNALNEELFNRSKENNDEIGVLISQYYKCSALFDTIEFESCEQLLLQMSENALLHQIPLYELRTYNLLAVISSESANHFESLNYYLQALHITNLHPELQYGCIIGNNIGKLFIELNEYESALSCLLQAYETYINENSDIEVVIITITLNVIECYGCMKQYDKANEWANKSLSFESDVQHIIHSMILSNQIVEAYDNQKFDDIHTYVTEMLTEAKEDDMYIYFFKIYLRVLKVLLSLGKKELCDTMMKAMEQLNKSKPKGTKIASFLYEYAYLKVEYYNSFIKQDDSRLKVEELLEEYVEYSTEIVSQLKKTYTHSMVVQLEKKQLELDKQTVVEENELLEKNIQLDAFTGLYNKLSLRTHIEESLTLHSNTQCALFVLDIDFFKHVNDTYGHEVGDTILLEVASSLQSLVATNGFVGRFGGDEFTVFLFDYKDEQTLLAFSQQLIEKGRTIYIPDQHKEHITFSVGVACYQEHDDFDEMFRNADKALYDRKHHGRDGYTIYGQ